MRWVGLAWAAERGVRKVGRENDGRGHLDRVVDLLVRVA